VLVARDLSRVHGPPDAGGPAPWVGPGGTFLVPVYPQSRFPSCCVSLSYYFALAIHRWFVSVSYRLSRVHYIILLTCIVAAHLYTHSLVLCSRPRKEDNTPRWCTYLHVVVRGVDGIRGVGPLPDVGYRFGCRTVDALTTQCFFKPPVLLLLVRFFIDILAHWRRARRILRSYTLQVVFVPPCGILKRRSYLLTFSI